MSNIPFEIICPLCGNRFVHCANHDCDDCKYVESSDCFKGCDCTITNILKELKSQTIQLQIENQALMNECIDWRRWAKKLDDNLQKVKGES